jgi:tetratricopeptide (TPR) repeat protein
MSRISYQDRFRRLGREYLLLTSIGETSGNIVCSLFYDGRLLTRQVLPPLADFEDRDLVEAVMEIHRQYLMDFSSLLGMVERTAKSDKPELIEKLGKTLLHRKLYDEGLELLENAVERYPDFSGHRILLGKIYLALDRLEDAQREFIHAVQQSPEYPDYRNLLGASYLRMRKAMAAIAEFRKSVELNVYYHRAYFNLGLAYILNGIVREDYKLARDLIQICEEAFEKATLFNPGYLNKDFERGKSHLQEGRLQEAYDILSKAARSGESSTFHNELLEMYLHNVHGGNGMTEKGVEDYIQKLSGVIKTKPGFADLHNELGMAYTIMGKLINDKAILHFREALNINPKFAEAEKNLKLSENDLKGFEILLGAILK